MSGSNSSDMNIEMDTDAEGQGNEEVEEAHHSLPSSGQSISHRPTLMRQRRQKRFLLGSILSFAIVGAVIALSVVLTRDNSSKESSQNAIVGSSSSSTNNNNNLDENLTARTGQPGTVITTAPTAAMESSVPVPIPTPSSSSTESPSETNATIAPTTNATTTSVPSNVTTLMPTNASNFFSSPLNSSAPSEAPSQAPSTPSPTTSVSPTVPPPTVAPLSVTARGSFILLETVNHDSSAFTQGLEVLSLQRLQYGEESSNGTTTTEDSSSTATAAEYMLESTGLYGESTLRLVEIATGQVLEELEMDDSYFAEGCTYYQIIDDEDNNNTDVIRLKVVQLTWRSGTGFVYELSVDTALISPEDPTATSATLSASPFGLELVGTFDIKTTNGQGWGIVYHPTLDQFIVSDGTDNLHFWELRDNPPGNDDLIFELVRTLPVTRRLSTNSAWTGVARLNELEWDPYSKDGTTILANVWQTDDIVRIRLEDGRVTHQYDMSTLEHSSSANVLNGIAAVWDSTVPSTTTPIDNQFWITGKYWSEMYRVRLDSN
ncbi:MAG: hypothetical protein SGILL_002675 [Bacillariaceae sp.]